MPDNEQVELKFRRDLSLLDVVMISAGAMTGASIYVLAGVATQWAGPAILISLVLSFFVTILTAMAYAELSSAFPEAGGGYLWVKEAMPKPLGFMSGWISWFGHSIACAFYTVVFAQGIVWLLQAYGLNYGIVNAPWFMKLIILIILVLFIYVNFMGTNITGKTQTFFTLFQFALIGIFIVAGSFAVVRNPNIVNSFTPFFTTTNGVIVAMSIMFIAFEGYEIAAQSAEEIKDPSRNLPKAIFYSITITTILYLLMFFVAIGSTSWRFVVSKGSFAMVDISGIVIPDLGKGIILIALLVGTIATLNATIFSSSRVSFAMGRDKVLPKIMGRIHPKHRTPYVAILVSGSIIGVIAIFLPFYDIAASADIMFLLLFILVNASVIILRYKMPRLKRSYLIPIFPLIPILGIITKSVLAIYLYYFSPAAWWLAIGWTEVGLILFYFSKGKREIEEYVPEPEKPIVKVSDKKRVMVATLRSSQFFVNISSWIAKENNYDLIIFSVIEMPSSTIRNKLTFSEYSEYFKKLESLAKYPKKLDLKPSIIATVSNNSANAILEEIQNENIDTLVIGWKRALTTKIFSSTTDTIYHRANCNLVIVRPSESDRYISSMSVIVRNPSTDEFTLTVARAIAKNIGCKVHFYAINRDEIDLSKYIDSCNSNNIESDSSYITTNTPESTIIDISTKTDLLIISHPDFQDYFYVPSRFLLDRFIRSISCNLIITKKSNKAIDSDTMAILHHG
ncbi:MAG: amino acid permease [Thermoplasmata archaeon]